MNPHLGLVLTVFALLSACDSPTETPAYQDPATCAVPTLPELYPGPGVPKWDDGLPAADMCLGSAHDVLLVLGCPSEDSGAPSDCQVRRADIAAALYRAGLGADIITSGGAVKNRFVEAEALRDLLIARGIPAARIHTEPKAEHTDENIYYSTKIMEAAGWNDALVVSDAPGHLVNIAVCDSNCCVKLGRLTVITLPVMLKDPGTPAGEPPAPLVVGHYARYPFAAAVTADECTHLQQPSKLQCFNLGTRRACADHLQLPQ